MTANFVMPSRPEMLCIGAFLIAGISLILTIRNFKQVMIGCITLPIAALCGGSVYLLTGWLYTSNTGTLYGLMTFALSGLIIVSILRWITSLNTY